MKKGKLSGFQVNFDSGLYLDPTKGANWWEYYFEPLNIGSEDIPKQNLSLPEICLLGGCQGFALSREKAFRLIQKYISIKPHIQIEVDDFFKRHFKGCFVIGVHHRGTDKKLEATPVPYEKTYDNLQAVIGNLSNRHRKHYKIYVATDDQKFLDYLIDLFPKEKLIYHDFVRSTNDQPVHFNDQLYSSNYQKGKEALLDCLLLSKCNYLIFPRASSLSITSAFFNPFMFICPLSGDSAG